MMKRKLIALLCAMLIGICAFAESAAPTPEPTPKSAQTAHAGGSMSAALNGAELTLDFDPDPQFSLCRDGYVQSSFYAYGEGDLLYELYVTFPQSIRTGETVTPESALMAADLFSGVYLYISDASRDVCSAAAQYLTGPYPEGSGYTLTFDSVSSDGTLTAFAGALKASLVEMDANYLPTGTVNELSGSFAFSMDLGGETAPSKEERPAPNATLPPVTEAPDRPKEDGAAPSPSPIPDTGYAKRPPTPPSKLITPANAKKI